MSQGQQRAEHRARSLSGLVRVGRYHPMDALSPVAVTYGPAAEWDSVALSSIRLVRVHDAAEAARRMLTDRNVVASVVVERMYADADASLVALRSSAWRTASVVALTHDSWPAWTPWRRSRRIDRIDSERLALDLAALLEPTGTRAVERHARIDRYGGALGLSKLEADAIWQADRGVPLELLEFAQGCGYETRKQRLARLKAKTSVELEQALAEATGEY